MITFSFEMISLPLVQFPVFLHFWATVTSNGSPMLWDHCPLCLSVMLVYCGQMVGWIKIRLGTEVGLAPDDIVLDGDPALPKERGAAAAPNFGPCLFRPMSIVAKWSPISATAELLFLG